MQYQFFVWKVNNVSKKKNETWLNKLSFAFLQDLQIVVKSKVIVDSKLSNENNLKYYTDTNLRIFGICPCIFIAQLCIGRLFDRIIISRFWKKANKNLLSLGSFISFLRSFSSKLCSGEFFWNSRCKLILLCYSLVVVKIWETSVEPSSKYKFFQV